MLFTIFELIIIVFAIVAFVLAANGVKPFTSIFLKRGFGPKDIILRPPSHDEKK